MSSYHLVLIGLDRYRILFEGVAYIQRRSISSFITSVGTVWFASIWFILPIIIGTDSLASTFLPRGHCTLTSNSTWILLGVLINFIVPSILLLKLYSRVYYEIKRRINKSSNTGALSTSTSMSNISVFQQHLSRQDLDEESLKKPLNLKRERTAVIMLSVLIGLFIGCWSFFSILTVVTRTFGINSPQILYVLGATLGWINSCANPIVYAVQNKDFRNGFKNVYKFIVKHTRLNKLKNIRCRCAS
jgi:hypothetical protein